MEPEMLVKEYETLRSELKDKISVQNTLLTFGITTVVAVMFCAVNSGDYHVFLLAHCIIIPMLIKITYYHAAMVRIASYIVVFIEPKVNGLNWEKRVAYYFENREDTIWKKITSFQRFFDLGALGFICSILCAGSYIRQTTAIGFWGIIANVVFPLLLAIIEILIIMRVGVFPNSRKAWIEEWEKIKEKEERDGLTF